jgi:pheromone shutdown protein TraB
MQPVVCAMILAQTAAFTSLVAFHTQRCSLGWLPSTTSSQLKVSTSSILTESVSDDGIIHKFLDNATGQQVTLIGTAHLSEKSHQQVKSIIAEVQPDVVLVELDASRLERLGIDDINENLGTLQVVTVEDIQPPQSLDDVDFAKRWFSPFRQLRYFCIDLFTEKFSGLLSEAQRDEGDTMGGIQAGGEFVVAIDAAKTDPKCKRLVLGDRKYLTTVRRAFELTLREGNPLKVLTNLHEVSEASKGLKEEFREHEGMEEASEGEFNVAYIEALKNDPNMRERKDEPREMKLPAFTCAAVTERDYIMAEAIRREIAKGASHMVAVVGWDHVPGMAKNLQKSWKGGSLSS